MRIELSNSQLLLRDYTLDDFDAFCAMSSEQKFQRFYSEQDCSKQHWLKLITQFSQEHLQQPRKDFNFAIIDTDTQRFIGAAGIRLESDYQASVGCALMRAHQNNNNAKAALTLIAQFGFEQQNVHRIYAHTIAENKAAIRLCRQLGMRKEAHFVEDRYFKGRWWDSVIYALTEHEYQQQK